MKYSWEFKWKLVDNSKAGIKNRKPDHVKCNDRKFDLTVRQYIRIYESTEPELIAAQYILDHCFIIIRLIIIFAFDTEQAQVIKF